MLLSVQGAIKMIEIFVLTSLYTTEFWHARARKKAEVGRLESVHAGTLVRELEKSLIFVLIWETIL